MAAVGFDSSFGSRLCTHCTCPFDPPRRPKVFLLGLNPNKQIYLSSLRPSCILQKSLSSSLMTLHCAHCLHLALSVGFCHHPALSNSGSCCPLHQEPGKSHGRTGLSLSNLLASCQSERCCQTWILLAFSVASCPLTWALNSAMPATSSPICTFAICRTSLTIPTKLVPIACMLTATCSESPSRLLVAAPFLIRS